MFDTDHIPAYIKVWVTSYFRKFAFQTQLLNRIRNLLAIVFIHIKKTTHPFSCLKTFYIVLHIHTLSSQYLLWIFISKIRSNTSGSHPSADRRLKQQKNGTHNLSDSASYIGLAKYTKKKKKKRRTGIQKQTINLTN